MNWKKASASTVLKSLDNKIKRKEALMTVKKIV